MSSTIVRLTGYQMTEIIYSGSRTLVYQGIRESDQKPVVIKLLKSEYPSFGELVQFRNQYTITKNLDLPGIVKPYSLKHYRNGYGLVMEDFGGISLKTYCSNLESLKLTSLKEFFDIALQIASILDGLYRNRVIHKDIKPANILINRDTKQVKLIDFSIASLLPRETQVLQSPNVLEGTLAYLSPEQTGRMNRGIDYRSDFYSLGVTFYELLTGQLPFPSTDPMELVHCHIAKQPPSVHSINPDIPIIVSDMISKLMAKNAEDRYQSALGLKYDLETCFNQWQETGRIKSFELGTHDICDRFVIPEKLYGRAKEVETLLAAFDRVAGKTQFEEDSYRGRSEMILVAGFSGIGKTAVVNEVHKPIVRQRGYFIKGKFDQFMRNIPFSAFVQAFRDLMGQLLTERDAQLQHWKIKILLALGENGQVIIDVIPELERIIGKQSPVPDLSAGAAQNRFNRLFQKFIQVFTSAEHPLVIFLDDLQWVDSASLKLMQLLISETDTRYLLLIGAYRDNEVSPTHPLMLTLDEISKTEVNVNSITLAPLKHSDLNHLIADTLSCSEELAQPLTELVFQKTKGNPFFATQFLKSLHADNLIRFNFEVGHWECDIAQVRALALSDDVVEFMALQLRKLPAATQQILQLAACIGNQFDLATLAIVYEKSQTETAADLWKALQEGLLLPQSEIYKFFQTTDESQQSIGESYPPSRLPHHSSPIYKFLHDRVQQAAYCLIAQDHKQQTHLKIGQLLLSNTSEQEQEEKIFDIVNQLNIGADLITNSFQRDQLAELNLLAGKKAKSATAYQPALRYFNYGLKLLRSDSWESNYDLSLSLSIAAVEAEYLTVNLERAKHLSNIVLKQANNFLDKVKVYELQILFYITQNKMNEAIDLGINVLKMLGIAIPTEAQEINTEVYQLREELQLEVEDIANLANLPDITDPYQLAAIRILTNASSASYIANPVLWPLIILTTVKLCIKYGHSSWAASAYSWYGALLCGAYLDIDRGYEFGRLSIQLLEQYNALELTAKVGNMFDVFVRPWKEHIRETDTSLIAAIQSGFDNGDIEYAFYAAVHYCNYHFFAGNNLDSVQRIQGKYFEAIAKAKFEFHESFIRIGQQTVANLLGQVANPRYLVGDYIDESTILPNWIENNIVFLVLCAYGAKTMLLYLFKEYTEAVEAGAIGKHYEQAAAGTLYVSEHSFYYSLALLANCNQVDSQQKQEALEIVAANQERLRLWAQHAPVNYQHQYDLVEAERARVEGNILWAMEGYDRAITGAMDTGYLQVEALANELAAEFFLDWDKTTIAQAYLTNAYYAYARWGAKAKVEDLEKRYTELLAPILVESKISVNPSNTVNPTVTSSSTKISEALDLASVIKASQVLSSEIHLDQLLSTLMEVVIENAGAEKCVLMLPKAGKWVIEAQGSMDQVLKPRLLSEVGNRQQATGNSGEELTQSDAAGSWGFPPEATASRTGSENYDSKNLETKPVLTVLQSIPIEESNTIPISVINAVSHKSQALVFDNASEKTTLAADPYIIQQQPKSVLCTPILNQGKLIGILYLENNQCTAAFTSDRLEVLKLLCSQAAISLENAQLYTNLERAKSQLEDYSHNLEEKVAERTQELSQTLEDLKATQKKLVESEKMAALGGLVAGVAHEINTPVGTSITAASILADETKGFRQALQDGKLKRSVLNNYLDTVEESSELILSNLERAGELVQSFKQVAVDQAHLDKRTLNVKEYLEEVLISLEPQLKQTSHTLTIEGDETVTIETYPGAISQVITNLVMNSISHGYQPKQNGQLHLQVDRVEEQLMITYHDDGCGIAQDHLGQIFEPFFTTARARGGSGLGLHIVYNLVTQKLLGQIEVNSQIGKGTEFIITIPIG
ncbi:trifunctional serine/threonine-protein kinase/ATP-binding protein/sensor histidine kinase [Moorena producens JHB]|uniref:histidine kinase n=1 Tax=Moorena producens (strain JHB) TaxID=1454205 RepID=A0A1D9G4X5_MOOP1|nr:ATP-binding sensor histidine kinase [Moorena producens]AOY82692.1 trifunctional serine/threonine-protein kinase/ATP-binding protein/sensor histidine kinase [Moorena producens JHB]